MKKFLLIAMTTGLMSGPALACNMEEASAKMTSIFSMPEYTAMLSATDTPEDAQKVADLNKKVNDAGMLAASGKYGEACATYDEAIAMLKGTVEEVQATSQEEYVKEAKEEAMKEHTEEMKEEAEEEAEAAN